MALSVPLHSSVLSNQTAIHITGAYKSHALTAIDTAYVSRPFIDRIVLVGELKPSDVALEAQKQGMDVSEYFKYWLGIPVSWFHEKAHGYVQPKKLVRGYFAGQKLMGPNAASVVWGISKNKHGARNVRIEFNPNKLSKAGLDEIRSEWALMFFGELKFDDWLRRARVTSLQVAVDIVNVPIDDLAVTVNGNGKWTYWLGVGKELQTVTSWAKVGKKQRIFLTVYDKRVERLDAGAVPQFGVAPHVRVERRLENKKIALRKLDRLTNPFDGVVLQHMPTASAGLSSYWLLFMLAAQVVGTKAALSYVPKLRRKAFRDAAKSMPTAPFWRPAVAWSGWAVSLKTSGVQQWIDIAMQN